MLTNDVFAIVCVNIVNRYYRHAANGLWLCTLIPCALLSNIVYWHHYTQLYRVVSMVAVCLFLCSVWDILHNGRERYRNDDEVNTTNTVRYLFVGHLCSSLLVVSLWIKLVDDGKFCPRHWSRTFFEVLSLSQNALARRHVDFGGGRDNY